MKRHGDRCMRIGPSKTVLEHVYSKEEDYE